MIAYSTLLGATQFDQSVLNMALIHLCNQKSHIGQELRKLYIAWKDETDEPMNDPWQELHQFMIYVPHPQQQYEGMTLEEGLTLGYNIEIKQVADRSHIPYSIPPGGQFVVVLKQKSLDASYKIAATGIFVRPLAVLSLDMVVDPEKSEYQSILVKHPIIRNYPEGWEKQLKAFINREIRSEDLPGLVGHVDQSLNPDYRPPFWEDVSLAAKGIRTHQF